MRGRLDKPLSFQVGMACSTRSALVCRKDRQELLGELAGRSGKKWLCIGMHSTTVMTIQRKACDLHRHGTQREMYSKRGHPEGHQHYAQNKARMKKHFLIQQYSFKHPATECRCHVHFGTAYHSLTYTIDKKVSLSLSLSLSTRKSREM